jgi:hypothetical protein
VNGLLAQSPSPLSQESERSATLARIISLRDNFVARVHASAPTCTIAAPKMEVRDVPSFGDYDDATNTISTTDWTLLPQERKAVFFQMGGPGADEAAVHTTFETTMHRWMLVHELAHWWQACNGKMNFTTNRPPFQVGLEADRITLAYWRQADPQLPTVVAAVVQGMIEQMPSPVPSGASYEDYFNKNYKTLPPNVHPWFAAHMILAACAEKPAPTFDQTLALGTH